MKKLIIVFLLLGACKVHAQNSYSIEKSQQLNAEVYQLVFNPTNQKIYVAGPKTGAGREGDNFIYALDAKTLQVEDSINVGKNVPYGLGINTKTQTIYAGNSRQNTLTAVDLKSKKVTVIPNGKEKSKIREIAVDEQRNEVYVSDHGNPGVWIVDGKTNQYKGDIAMGKGYLLGLGVDPARGKIYQTDGETMEGYVNVYDSETKKLVSKYKTWSYCPMNIAVDHKNNRIFVSQSTDNNVTVLDGNTGEIITKVHLGVEPSSPIGLMYDEENDIVFTANRRRRDVAVIDMKNYKITQRIPTVALPNTIALDKSTGDIFVTLKKEGRGEAPVENGNSVIKITKAK